MCDSMVVNGCRIFEDLHIVASIRIHVDDQVFMVMLMSEKKKEKKHWMDESMFDRPPT